MVHGYHGLEPDSKSAPHYLFTLFIIFFYHYLRRHFCWSLFIVVSAIPLSDSCPHSHQSCFRVGDCEAAGGVLAGWDLLLGAGVST